MSQSQTPLDYFLSRVRVGDKLSSSFEARAASRLAVAIIENVPRMDAQSIEGARDFLSLAATSYREALEALR